jgi:hypothetical protein
MKRGMTALVSAAVLLASLPGSAGAARVSKGDEHFVYVSCDAFFDGGYVNAYAEDSTAFGASGSLDLWLDPAIPFDDPASATGSGESVDIVEGTNVTATGSFQLTDSEGTPLGDGSFTATLEKVGDPYTDLPSGKTNHHSATLAVHQDLGGSGVATVLGVVYDVQCSGQINDTHTFESNPTSFVSSNAGVNINCFWDTGDASAGLFAQSDSFGGFADAFIFTPDLDASANAGATFTLNATSIDIPMSLSDNLTGETIGDVSVTGSFSPIGDPDTSFLIQQNALDKLTEQALAPHGSVDFSTGQSFSLDTDHCTADAFASHVVVTASKGPKPGAAPPNDAPDGAIALKLGSSLNVMTTGTVVPPEVGITTCPEGDRDNFGHTVWYTFQGTGDPVTIDTSGSNFDTVVGVFTRDGEAWTEVGCDDDLPFVPGQPLSLQTILTVPTEAGVTYYVEAGGFRWFFDLENAQSGRLRLAIN